MNHLPRVSTSGRVCANDAPADNVEVVLHITETLDSVSRNELQAVLLGDNGVFSAEFCPLRYHLLLVQYDSTQMNSRDVLAIVLEQNFTAQILGPIWLMTDD
jgi:hypothetical protein